MPRKTKRRGRRPNGQGSVIRLSGNRCRPYAIKFMIDGRQQIVDYAKTYEEAEQIRIDYIKAPWAIDAHQMTLDDVYQLWKIHRWPLLSSSNQQCLRAAYNYCGKYKNMLYKNITSLQMQDTINSCTKSLSTKTKIRNLWVKLECFARELRIVTIPWTDMLSCDTAPPVTKKTIFSDSELKILHNQNTDDVDCVLILLYTGLRISEMLMLTRDDIDWENRYFRTGLKTAAGKNRIVPIHEEIAPILKKYYNNTDHFLFTYNGRQLSAPKCRSDFKALMTKLGMNHLPHECRHTFRSKLDSAGANQTCIDLIMGHKSGNIGERVYTHKSIEELKQTIKLLKYPK